MELELAKVAKKNTNHLIDVQLFFMTVGSRVTSDLTKLVLRS
jgi:hypothetical protein